MWTRFRNDGNCIPTQYSQAIEQPGLPRRFAKNYGLRNISGRHHACTSTEETSRLRASASLRVQVSDSGHCHQGRGNRGQAYLLLVGMYIGHISMVCTSYLGRCSPGSEPP